MGDEQGAMQIDQESDFTGAFAEATGEVVQQASDVAPPGQAPEATVVTPVAQAQDTTVVSTGDQPPATEVTDYKALYEAEVQRTKSWEGRVSATARENNDLKEELMRLKTPSTPTRTETDSSTIAETDDPVLKSFVAEMGEDFIKPMDKFVATAVAAAIKPLVEKIETLGSLEQRVAFAEQSRDKEHFTKIQEAHPDVVKLVEKDATSGKSAIDLYVEALPYVEAVERQRVIKSGTTKEVIDFLNEFKEKTKTITPKVVVTDATKQKQERMTVVKSDAVTVQKPKEPATDFEGAFAEATAQK